MGNQYKTRRIILQYNFLIIFLLSFLYSCNLLLAAFMTCFFINELILSIIIITDYLIIRFFLISDYQTIYASFIELIRILSLY